MEQNELTPELADLLQQLTTKLGENELITRYQSLAKQVAEHQKLQALEEEIKAAQKNAVNFEHYEKPAAAKAERARADQLTTEFNNHPLVIAYRESLYEANELLHYLTRLIEEQVNRELTEGSDRHAAKD
ncbi:YlbF family regulator [Enterococcus nangangensis]